MLSAAHLHRRLAPLVGVGIALVSACLLPAAAGAAGFSGSFDPANWSIVNTTAGSVDQTLSGSGSPPAYTCTETNDVACAENVDATNGGVDVVGSVAGFDGGGTGNTARTTTWTVTNGAQSSSLMFSWAFATTLPAATNQSAWYLVGTNATQLTATDGDSGSVSNFSLAPFETFGFRVSTTDNTGDYGVLSITNFTATPTAASEVPAPLPLAGAAAGFSWSRRLRRRSLAPRP